MGVEGSGTLFASNPAMTAPVGAVSKQLSRPIRAHPERSGAAEQEVSDETARPPKVRVPGDSRIGAGAGKEEI